MQMQKLANYIFITTNNLFRNITTLRASSCHPPELVNEPFNIFLIWGQALTLRAVSLLWVKWSSFSRLWIRLIWWKQLGNQWREGWDRETQLTLGPSKIKKLCTSHLSAYTSFQIPSDSIGFFYSAWLQRPNIKGACECKIKNNAL